MAVYSFHLLLVNLTINDTPVGYSPARGPSVQFQATYNHRETLQPAVFSYSNLGPKWTFDWLSYVEDDPANLSGSAKVYARGGGYDTYTGFSGGSYAPNVESRAVLVRTSTSPVRYEHRFPDGSVQVFAQPDGSSTVPRRVFLTEVRDPQDQAVTYTYDASLRLVAAADALGQVTTVSYEDSDPLKITKVTDPYGRFARFEYTGDKLTRITDAIGITSEFTYQTGDFISALTTPYGTTGFAHGLVGANAWAEVTDAVGGQERVENWSTHTALPIAEPAGDVPTGFASHNLQINGLLTLHWPKRAAMLHPGDPTKARQTRWLRNMYSYTVASTPHSTKEPLENRVWYAYPGQTSGGMYLGTHAQPSKIARVLDDGQTQLQEFEYNAKGNQIRAIDPVGRETVSVYGTNNVPDPDPATGTGIDLLQTKVKNTASPSGWDVTSSSTYNTQGQPLTTTDAAGQVTTYTYDAQGRAQTVTTPPRAGITEDRTTTYAYDPVTGNVASVTGPGGVTTSYTNDGDGRLRTTTDSDNYTLTYDYDSLDRQTKVTYPDGTYEETVYGRLDPERRRDRLGRWTHTFYDVLRRVVSTRDPEGRTVTQEWCACGDLDKMTDANGNATRWERDAQGRLTREVRMDGTAKDFTYEATTSRLRRVRDAKGQEIHSTYALDDKPLLTSYVNAEHPTPNVSVSYTDPTTSAPDAYGRLRQMTDGTGTTSYTYHGVSGSATPGAGQIASVDGPLVSDTITYSYDERGRTVSRTLNGVTSTWSFDQQGRLQSQTDPIGTFTYGYAGNSGRVQAVTYPNGQTTSYSYFPVIQDLRLQEIHHKKPDATALSRFAYTYDVVGSIKTWTQQTEANAANAYDFEYDRADQLKAATYRTTTPTPTTLKRYRYAYDPAGNRTAEQLDDVVTSATHDAMNRLVSQQPGGALLFEGTVSEPSAVTVAGSGATVTSQNVFAGSTPMPSGTGQVAVQATDPSGNIRTNTYQVDQAGPTTISSYDLNGNMTSDGTNSYEWDAENRLIRVKQGASTLASFTYDGQGGRATKTAGGVTITYVYEGSQFLEERPTAGSTKRHVYGPGIDRPLAQVVDAAITYLAADHLGSIARVTDSSGAATVTRDYDPWGNQLQGASASGYAFTGREWDSETGLYYYHARHYDPSRGRFIGEDPVGLHASNGNPFLYASNMPQRRVDPSGLDATINYWEDAAHGFGHIGVAVNSADTEGYYSTGAPRCLAWGCTVPGRVARDANEMRYPLTDTVTIQTTAAQDEAMCMTIKERRRNPGRYHLYDRNCSLFVVDVMEAGGVRFAKRSHLPSVIFWFLKVRE